MTLDELRRRLDAIDRELLELVARRQALAAEVAEEKRRSGAPVRDFAREREVIIAARAQAVRLGISPETAEALLRKLIRSSLATQERASVAAHGVGSGRRALVIGGAGKMGRWFVDLLASQGYAVEVSDPAAAPDAARCDWRADPLAHDLVVVATPLGATDAVLRELAARRPKGLVFDVGSLKSPLRAGLAALKDAGAVVTSVHPMFGPDTELLSGKHVVFVDLGVPEALERAQELFAPTMAEHIVMGLDEHDRLIAYVLGLSHALNIAFFTALADSGEAAPHLAEMSSTTFDAQLAVATRVAEESADLYYEIQSLNDYGAESLAALSKAVERVRAAVSAKDRDAFIALMRRGHAYLSGRRNAVAARR
jgi:chorismate mutase/prephenate dehydrogenase